MDYAQEIIKAKRGMNTIIGISALYTLYEGVEAVTDYLIPRVTDPKVLEFLNMLPHENNGSLDNIIIGTTFALFGGLALFVKNNLKKEKVYTDAWGRPLSRST